MAEDQKYNGWSNYETWCVSLWLSNNEYDYLNIQEKIAELKKTPEIYTFDGLQDPMKRPIKNSLSDWLKEIIVENNPIEKASVYLDLLTKAIDNVDFNEIAENYLEE